MMLRHSPLDIHYAHHHQVSYSCNFTRSRPYLCSLYRPPTVRQRIFLTTKRRYVTNHFGTDVNLAKEEDEDANKANGKENYGFQRKKLAVFVSGGGSNLLMIHKATMEGKIHGDISVVVSDKPDCKACSYAKSNSISVIEYPKSKVAESGLAPCELVASLRAHGIDFILLAGYLKLVPVELVRAYPRAILNIHPALLPAFGGKGYYGRKVHEAVIKSGAKYSGPTIHFVDEEYDRGKILAQSVVSVLPEDTVDDLSARVLKQEHELYPEVVAALCEGRIFWRDDGIPIIRGASEAGNHVSFQKGFVSVYDSG